MNQNQAPAPQGQTQAARRADQFARRIASSLDAGLEQLPHDISERLRAGRERALERRRRPVSILVNVPAVSVQAVGGGVAALGPDDRPGFWQFLGSALPIVALLVGLVLLDNMQAELRARELADVDTALLTDDVPPSAYADPGFLHFVQSEE